MDRLDLALADLGRSLGMSQLVFTDDECRLETDEVAIDIVADRKRGALVLTALVADLPDGDRTEILGYLLDLNTGPALGGPALGVPAGSGAILLTDQLAAGELQPGWFLDRVRTFARSVGTARGLIGGPVATETAVDDSSTMIRV